MNSFDTVFALLGGPAEVGRIINVTTEHAVQMRRRGSIPPEHWPAIVRAAADRGLSGITHEALKEARRSKRMPARAA